MGCMLKGRKMSGLSCAEYAPVNPRRVDADDRHRRRVHENVLPITSCERPNCFAQNASLMVTTGPLPTAPIVRLLDAAAQLRLHFEGRVVIAGDHLHVHGLGAAVDRGRHASEVLEGEEIRQRSILAAQLLIDRPGEGG